MEKYNLINIETPKLSTIKCDFYEHQEECILQIVLSGKCSEGSQGENYGASLYQLIGLALLKVKPLAVLIDLQDLVYNSGDRIINLFQIFDDINYLDKDNIITAFVLSEKNKLGLSSLLQFDIKNPKAPFFLNLDKAYKQLFLTYDQI